MAVAVAMVVANVVAVAVAVGVVGLNRQKYLPRPTTDRRLGIARIQNRTKGAKNKVKSEQ